MSQFPDDAFSRTSSKNQASALVCRICGQSVAIGAAKTDGDGQAIHEECYAQKLKSERASLAGGVPQSRPWKVIAAELSHEQDSKKMTELVAELNQALDEQNGDGIPKLTPDTNPKSNGRI